MQVDFGVKFNGTESEFKRIVANAVGVGGKLNIDVDDQWANMQMLNILYGVEWKYVGVNHVTGGVAAINQLDPQDIEYATEDEFISAVEAFYKEVV